MSEIEGTERAASARLAGAVTDHVERATSEDRQREADRSEMAQSNPPKAAEAGRASEAHGAGEPENQLTSDRQTGGSVDILA